MNFCLAGIFLEKESMNNLMRKMGLGWVILMVVSACVHAEVINLALSGTAKQSSTTSLYVRPNGGSGPAEKGNDGNTNGLYDPLDGSPGSVTHTEFESNPWWEVLLEGDATIQRVAVFNRTDFASEILNDFKLILFDGDLEVFVLDPIVFQEDATVSSPPEVSGMSFDWPGLVGDRVRVQLNAVSNLHIAELEVWGELLPPPPVPTPGVLTMFGAGLFGMIARGRRA
jgi:hypothetical protein